MTSAHVPYHLRANKAADRALFLEALVYVHGIAPLHRYQYMGFGGAFLEDFRAIHSQFGIRKLVSIESDANVFTRQKFNRPNSLVKLDSTSSDQFVAKFERERPTIAWFDYGDPSKIGHQLSELQAFASKLEAFDVVRVTFNANPLTLYENRSEPVFTRREKQFEKFRMRVSTDHIEEGASADSMTLEGYAHLLRRGVMLALSRGVAAKVGTQPLELLSLRYSDGPHQMLTVTSIMLSEDDTTSFRKKSGIKKWEFFAERWQTSPFEIAIPAFSAKEKSFVDSRLPRCSAATLRNQLGFYVGRDDEAFLSDLKSYARVYRHSPHFSRILP